MTKTFKTEKRVNHNQTCAHNGCPEDSLCVYFVAVQLEGEGRTPNFPALRSNGDTACFKSRSGAYQYGRRYFG